MFIRLHLCASESLYSGTSQCMKQLASRLHVWAGLAGSQSLRKWLADYGSLGILTRQV